ncbi:S-layer homology domain-containing protein [Cytobacillus sp. S13-E01]|uniref:S-layer homology domain-containing protein n=1 Tax=Cytobacillus sp. S13-E01 TaxID=3031326 RepID=UPI0023D85A53|nr:S-layer homology domain-containing protein [Cytobacillus sp. S13-E01]MDF0726034.1 S-layer homology domain-containing protein [Cytobacillus sp. S13-E01]
MYNIKRHELNKVGNRDILVLYLDQGVTEFSKELGSDNKIAEQELDESVKSYIKQKFPNLRNATVKVMVGSMLVTTFAFTPALGLTGVNKASAEGTGASEAEISSVDGTTPVDEPTVDDGTTPVDEPTVDDGTTPVDEPAVDDGTTPVDEPAVDDGTTPVDEPAVDDGTTPVDEPAVDDETTPVDEDADLAVDVPFTDIENLTEEKYAAIWSLYQFGVINGFEDGTYRPDVTLTRGQAALMFFNTGWFPATGDATTAFPDVKNERYFEAVSAMKSEGIFEGNTNGTFGIGDTLTREQMASVIVRAFGLEPIEGEPVDLVDLDKVSDKHKEDVRTLYQHGITIGNLEGEYNPTGTVNRGDFGLFLYRSIINEISPSFDNSTATVVNNGDLTATITVTVNDRAGDPVIGLEAGDFTVGLRDEFYTVGDTPTLRDFSEVADGVYEVTFAPGSAINETVDIYVFDSMVIEDLIVVTE